MRGDFTIKCRSLRRQRSVCDVGLIGKCCQNLEPFQEFCGADEYRKVVLFALFEEGILDDVCFWCGSALVCEDLVLTLPCTDREVRPVKEFDRLSEPVFDQEVGPESSAMLDNISPMKLAKIRNIPEDEIDTRLPVAGDSGHPLIVRLKKQ